jgi:hypothetical protein
MNQKKYPRRWKWKKDLAHRKAFLDALADQIKTNHKGILLNVPSSFSQKFSKWFAPISYYGFGYGDGVECGGIRNQVDWALSKQSERQLAKTHVQGLVLRTEYRIELQHRGIKVY